MKRPSFQFYPSDWLRDTGLRTCSVGARGLWMDMICFMHEGTPYGVLKVGSKVILPSNLASMVGATLQDVEGWLEELESVHVFDRDENGAIMSRRMIRDENTRELRAAGGKLGGNPALKQGKVNLQSNLKDNLKSEAKVKQNPTPSSSSASSFSSPSPSTISSTQEENMSADADVSDFFAETETTPKKKPTGEYPPKLIELWDMFPPMARTRSSKADFWTQYRQATNKPPHADLVRSVALWTRCDEWTKNNGQFAPGAHHFFKNRKWESEPVMYSPTRQKGTIENIQLKILNGPDKNV